MSHSSYHNLKGLYAITDPDLMGDDLLSMSEQAILAGINILQYRNKKADAKMRQQEASILSELCKHHRVTFIINDDVELAREVDADGVHIGQKDMSTLAARNFLGANKIIGVTCNNQITLAEKAQNEGADYVAFGRFFTSRTKPGAPAADLALLNKAKNIINLPIVAIGGITTNTASELLHAGADMLAVIHSLFGQKEVFSSTQEFVEIIKRIDTPSAST